MANYAKLTLIGRLGADPEPNKDRDYSNISVAVTDKDTTTWWRLMVFGKTRDFVCKYLKKGDEVFVEATPHKDSVLDNGRNTIYERNYVNTIQKLSWSKDKTDNPF